MDEMIAIVLLIKNFLFHWTTIGFEEICIPFVMTVVFVSFFRFVVLPIVLKYDNKVFVSNNNHEENVSVQVQRARKIVKNKFGSFLTKEEQEKRKQALRDCDS